MTVTPNVAGDWLHQRNDDFTTHLALGDKDKTISTVFELFSGGLKTNRDAWCYNFAAGVLEANIEEMVGFYNSEVERIGGTTTTPNLDPERFSWDRADRANIVRRRTYEVDGGSFRTSIYRPFTKIRVCFDRSLNNTVYRQYELFPTREHANVGFYQVGAGSAVPFSVLMLDSIPDLHVTGAGSGGQFFARWRYVKVEDEGTFLIDVGDTVGGYRRVDNITDEALGRFHTAYGKDVTKDEIFFYCYGLLHSPDYRERFAADLKKMLPRIPLVSDPWPFVAAGRALADLHLGYESVTPYLLGGLDVDGPEGEAAYDFFRVAKMTFAKVRVDGKLVADRSTIVYNDAITLTGVPQEAYRYQLGSRSAIEWILDRYQVKTDKASGIVNDPNDWSR